METRRVSYALFRKYLFALLPLRAPTGDRLTGVERYCAQQLDSLGRAWVQDKHGNILSPVGSRAIVAHTDAVDQREGKDTEPVYEQHGLVKSRNGRRPMGGDDKVGIAIALTIAATHPSIGVLLFADEESGCTGSRMYTGGDSPLDFAVQCDRKGANDLVCQTSWQGLCSTRAERECESILPHRESVRGGLTDVVELVANGVALNAVNMSCGYYNPHSRSEYIVLAHATQALFDAESLLLNLPVDMASAESERIARRAMGKSKGWGSFLGNAPARVAGWDMERITRVENGPYSLGANDWEEDWAGGYTDKVTGAYIDFSDVEYYEEYLHDPLASSVGYEEEEEEVDDETEGYSAEEKEAYESFLRWSQPYRRSVSLK